MTRIVGLLLWAYFFWMLTSLGILSNNINGALISLLLLASLSWFFYQQSGKTEISQWARSQIKTIIVVEFLFLFAFGIWTLVRSVGPEIQGTEKPMELAFINSISRSPVFPPSDPWLSGYSISYYYFGYVMVAILGYITGTLPSVSFNLALSTWFALTALGCYGVVINLLRTWQEYLKPISKLNNTSSFVFASLLGPLYVLIVSNIEGFLEMLHADGLFWQKNPDGSLTSKFWAWLNIQELNQPPSLPFSLVPNRIGGIWWWRASRVLQDFDIAGVSKEIIDEFPFFSYFLGDLHPHVLAMPLGLLAISIGINMFRGQKTYSLISSFSNWIRHPLLWFTVLTCGGIIFANTWDLPIYLLILLSFFLFTRIRILGWSRLRIWETATAGMVIVGLSILLFLPFFIGFSSQAGGILPSLNYFTPGKNFWIMFFPFLTIFMIFLVVLQVKNGNVRLLKISAIICAVVVIFLVTGSYVMAWLISNLSNFLIHIKNLSSNVGSGLFESISSMVNSFIGIHGGMPINEVISESLLNRLRSPYTMITLFFIGTICFSFLIFAIQKKGNNKENRFNSHSFGLIPIILLIFIGAGFCLIPEFFYLRDVFGTRMNTIFKFYFQSWIIWGVAAASASVILYQQFQKTLKKIFTILVILLTLVCCAYPIFGLIEKARNINFNQVNLDGSMFIKNYNTDEYTAIQWLRNSSYGTVAEAVGGSYSGFARVSTFSGLPTVLGWPGHEMQWRGGAKEIGSREGDIRLLYETNDWNVATEIIDHYQIRYIYVGEMERSQYQVNENKFADRLNKIFSNDTVAIYQVQF